LNCKHCGSRLLSRLIPANPSEILEQIARRLANNGIKGMLTIGGCGIKGKVPTATVAQYIKRIKQQTNLIVIAHTSESLVAANRL